MPLCWAHHVLASGSTCTTCCSLNEWLLCTSYSLTDTVINTHWNCKLKTASTWRHSTVSRHQRSLGCLTLLLHSKSVQAMTTRERTPSTNEAGFCSTGTCTLHHWWVQPQELFWNCNISNSLVQSIPWVWTHTTSTTDLPHVWCHLSISYWISNLALKTCIIHYCAVVQLLQLSLFGNRCWCTQACMKTCHPPHPQQLPFRSGGDMTLSQAKHKNYY